MDPTELLDYDDFTLDPLAFNETGLQDNEEVISNETVFSQYPPALLDFGAACCIVFTVVGFTGNLISIIALAKCPRLRNATTAFIINLCVADFLCCSFALPLSAVTFLERMWNYGETLCKLFPLFRYSNGAVSLLSVLAITINRYVLVVHPRKYPSMYRPNNIAIMILVMWIVSLFIIGLPFFEVWGKLGYDPKVGTCSIMKKDGKSPKVFIYAMAFALPSLVFTFCYSRIYCVVRRSSRNIKNSCRISTTETTRNSRQWFRKSRNLNPIGEKKELRVLRVMLVIFITFIMCYFPVSFVKIFKKENNFQYLNIFGYLAVYFSNCANPIIYVVMSKEYRQAYMNLFTTSTSTFSVK